MRSLPLPSPRRLAPLAATLALAAACADLPTTPAPSSPAAARPAASLEAAPTFAGRFDVDPTRTYCGWDANALVTCDYRVLDISGVPPGAFLRVRLDNESDITYRCQNTKNGRLDPVRTLAWHVTSIAAEYSREATQIEDMLGTVPAPPANLCRKNQVATEVRFTPRAVTLLFGYTLAGQFVVRSSVAFSAPGS